MKQLFPICLNMEDKLCLVIGGGKVAERKIAALLEHGARVKVVSNDITAQIKQWERENLVQTALRGFQEEDLNGVFLVFVATNDSQVNSEISRLCRQKGILANVVDNPDQCDFVIPAVVRRNSLVIAVSTEGKSPAYARKLRQQLEEVITPAYGEFVDLLGEVRVYLQKHVADIDKRKQIIESLVYSDILDLIQVGEKEKAKEKIRRCMSFWQD
ncbi:MAG: precorrin-2 dehydrogenase/sirohydrochlorin ferrochelatase family protein [Syntrophomonadaceae bacterium]|jgi:precorrin-2 dehydrogenase/sirohydrochlorin ferrochelatase